MVYKAYVTKEYRVQYTNPIAVSAGELVQVGPEDVDFPGWKWCKGSDGREGWVPVELLSGGPKQATVLEDYSARELAVKPGEQVVVEASRHSWLLVRNVRNERGWIPASHVDTTGEF
jgi:SH3-like domain-containing protein